MIELSQDGFGTALRMLRFGQEGPGQASPMVELAAGRVRAGPTTAAQQPLVAWSEYAALDARPPDDEPSPMSEPSGPKPAMVARRETGRRASGCMAGLEAEERARIQRLSPIERMALALRMGRVARAIASRVGPR
jgi:hypothetical protein